MLSDPGFAVSANPLYWVDPLGLDYWVYRYKTGAGGYGHVGMITKNKDGTFTRHSQGADNPNAPWYELVVPMHKAVVNQKTFSEFPQMPGAEFVRIPTKNDDQVAKAIRDYIKADWPYNAVTNNCADFVNDTGNAANDVSLSDRTIPNEYFENIRKKYGACACGQNAK